MLVGWSLTCDGLKEVAAPLFVLRWGFLALVVADGRQSRWHPRRSRADGSWKLEGRDRALLAELGGLHGVQKIFELLVHLPSVEVWWGATCRLPVHNPGRTTLGVLDPVRALVICNGVADEGEWGRLGISEARDNGRSVPDDLRVVVTHLLRPDWFGLVSHRKVNGREEEGHAVRQGIADLVVFALVVKMPPLSWSWYSTFLSIFK
jgi:hypothetical protein